jgi:two-component system phosphate regulon sensor histidine kinase PhoR
MKKIVPILGASIVVAAFCFIIFQLYWIREARQAKETEFNAVVNAALDHMVADMEKNEVMWHMKYPGGNFTNSMSGLTSHQVERVEFNVNLDSLPIRDQIASVKDNVLEQQLSELMTTIDERQRKQVDVQLEASKLGQMVSNKRVLVDNIVEKIISIELPIEQRISQPVLDTLICKTLHSYGINIGYEFAVFNEASQQQLFGNTTSNLQQSQNTDVYSRPLFPNDVLLAPHVLYVAFPYKWSYISSSLGETLVMSLGLVALIVGVFVATFLTLVHEKRLSQMRSDFVSNMTHELKTPISSITLAAELLHDPSVPAERKNYEKMSGIIFSQSKRLSQLVEHTLEQSMFERGHIKMQRKLCNAHALISTALDAAAFTAASKNAVLTQHLDAENACIKADELHFSNIIVNLLDNALKYSKEEPKIEVRTSNQNGGLLVQVADNGVGIPKEDRKRVFEQFYRVHTGNLHNVKGFGLGLHYVLHVVKIHGGKIWVDSELGKGSTFNVWMPQKRF